MLDADLEFIGHELRMNTDRGRMKLGENDGESKMREGKGI